MSNDHITVEALRELAVPTSSLTLDPENARKHGPENIAAIKGSLREFGIMEPVGVRDGVVIRGNGTMMALAELAREGAAGEWEGAPEGLTWDTVPAVHYMHLDDRGATRWGITHNHTAALATWDWRQLQATFEGEDPKDWESIGWALEEFEAIAGGEWTPPEQPEEPHPGPPGDAPEPQTPEPPSDPVTQVGDLWILGDHRLICGDCRDREVVARLLDGAEINVAFTSPPYASQRKYDESSGFRPIKPDDYVEWFKAVQANVREHLVEDGSWFVNIKSPVDGVGTHLYVLDLVIAHVREWGWVWGTEFCWERIGVPKSVAQRFKNQFEPVYQFAIGRWKMRPDAVRHKSANVPVPRGPGAGDTHWGDRNGDVATQGGSGEMMGQLAKPGLAYPGNRLPPFASARGVGHPAVFPVGLPTFFIKAYSDPGDAIFDPFMGSGTTIIASEREGRRGYGCELSPRYCDVIVARWEADTGGQAVLVRDGETTDFCVPPMV